MKILFCTQCVLTRQLGGSRVAMEIATALQSLGWETELRAIPDIHENYCARLGRGAHMRDSFRAFLQEHAAAYDVVDFDHAYLPWPREEFSPRTLLVARSVLLLEHLTRVKFPTRPTFRARIRALLTADRDGREERSSIAAARKTVLQADLVNVPNGDDRHCLEDLGMAPEKIVVIPYGIWPGAWPRAAAASTSEPPTVVFVGTFDYRKGCLDLVEIAKVLFSQIPDSRLRLLGTAGVFRTADKVREFFPRELWGRLEIVPQYEPEKLPSLLRGAAVGIFPSYLEGFGLAVVEMVAAGLPVLAYRAPGPSSILPDTCLIEPGCVRLLADQAVALLRFPELRHRQAGECRKNCELFDWSRIGRQTSDIYQKALGQLRSRPT